MIIGRKADECADGVAVFLPMRAGDLGVRSGITILIFDIPFCGRHDVLILQMAARPTQKAVQWIAFLGLKTPFFFEKRISNWVIYESDYSIQGLFFANNARMHFAI